MKYSFLSALFYRIQHTLFWLLALVTLFGVSAATTRTMYADVSVINREQSASFGPDDGIVKIFLPVIISNFSDEPTLTPTLTPIPTKTGISTPTPTPTPTLIPSTTSMPTPQAIHIAVIGDFGDDSPTEGNVATMITAQNPDFIITVGDNRYGSTTFDRVIGHYFCDYLADVEPGSNCAGGNRTTNAFFPVPGNHDYGDGGGIDEYLNYFTLPGSGIATTGTSATERYYDMLWGPVHFFFLDSDAAIHDLADRTAQQDWLFTQMTASTAAWQIVVLHHTPYSSALHGSSDAMKWPYLAWGADAVLAGHDHTYERINRDGLVYFVNGLGGRGIYDFERTVAGSDVRYDGDFGAMMIDADSIGIRFRFVTRTDVEIDRYTIGTAPPATPTSTPPASGIVDLRLIDSNDDVEEKVATGSIDNTSSDLELVYDGADQIIGLRFNRVQIPQGAIIEQAYLEFETDEIQNEVTDLTIRAEATDHPATFKFGLFDVSSRPLTNAATSWQPTPWTAVGAKYQTPELSAVVAEVINRSGWRSGNSLVFVISGSGHRTAKAVDGEPAAAPRLYVKYR